MSTASVWLLEIGRYIARLGGIGLIGIGLLDCSLIPVPGSQDFFTILLAARHRDWWFYYAVMSTVGQIIGSYLTYRLGHKGGEEALEKRLTRKRVEKISATYQKYGFMAVFVPALMPPPVPLVPFVLGAGALQYPLKKFLAALGAARFIRFTIAAYLASLYGRRVFGVLAHNGKLFLTVAVVLVAAGALTMVLLHLRKRHIARAQS